MPAAVYLFSLCTFAFGLSEFVVAGLVSAMAHDLLAPVQAVGGAVAAYALGAVVGAPFLTALAAGWQDRRQLALAMAALTIGSAAIGLASTLSGVLVLRFAVGLAHGVFMAVASDAATRLVGPARAGRALSLVWLGLTLALAVGVPLGTYLGSVWSWRAVFLAMAALGLLGMGGLLLLMPPRPPAGQAAGAAAALRALRHPQMLMTAGVGALVSVAVFAFFTFISPYLLQVASADARWLSLAMLLFGACTVGGNLLGGYLADGPAPDRNAQRALAALALNLCGLFLLRHSPVAVAALAGGLGLCFFAIVTMLTLRLLALARRYVPASTAAAAGLNIASFNLGTALGGALGSLVIAAGGLAGLPLAGAAAAVVAAAALRWQAARTPLRQAA